MISLFLKINVACNRRAAIDVEALLFRLREKAVWQQDFFVEEYVYV